jgi:glycosyltransferase involved in cell wall biosynthesis
LSKIIIFNWKDINHPKAGGAETVCHELSKRLVNDSHKVIMVTAKYNNAKDFEILDGIEIHRIGSNKYLHSFQALIYYIKNLRGKADIIIECVNTVPYFTKFFKSKEKVFLFYHQLAEKIWFFETKFPLSVLGYFILEPVATRLQSLFNQEVITISKSTKDNLLDYGFKQDNIQIISEGITNNCLIKYDPEMKQNEFTILFHSSLRSMKRPEHVILAFSNLVKKYPPAKLYISGGGDIKKYNDLTHKLGIVKSVTFFGYVSEEKKLELMAQSTVICSTSVKEGWGLIITEANSMATPSIVYDVDGLRDACKFGGGSIVKDGEIKKLSNTLVNFYDLFINQRKEYDKMCEFALQQAKLINFKQSYEDLKLIIFKDQ